MLQSRSQCLKIYTCTLIICVDQQILPICRGGALSCELCCKLFAFGPSNRSYAAVHAAGIVSSFDCPKGNATFFEAGACVATCRLQLTDESLMRDILERKNEIWAGPFHSRPTLLHLQPEPIGRVRSTNAQSLSLSSVPAVHCNNSTQPLLWCTLQSGSAGPTFGSAFAHPSGFELARLGQ